MEFILYGGIKMICGIGISIIINAAPGKYISYLSPYSTFAGTAGTNSFQQFTEIVFPKAVLSCIAPCWVVIAIFATIISSYSSPDSKIFAKWRLIPFLQNQSYQIERSKKDIFSWSCFPLWWNGFQQIHRMAGNKARCGRKCGHKAKQSVTGNKIHNGILLLFLRILFIHAHQSEVYPAFNTICSEFFSGL